MLRRLWALIQKEFIQLNRRTFIFVAIGSAVELLLFSAAIHTDVRHLPMVVADQSRSDASRSYLQAFTDSGDFDIVAAAPNQAEVMHAIDSGQASLGIVIPPDFAGQMGRGAANVLMLVDGSSSFTSQSAYKAASAISQNYSAAAMGQPAGPLTAHLQILYNPDLKDTWFITPAFLAMLLMAVGQNLTSLAVVREREMGTIEALLVTPVRPVELMIAKMCPALLVAFVSEVALVAVGTLVLGVPFRGNLWLFFAFSVVGVTCGLGLGLLISSAVQTQNQSQQLVSLINISGMFLGGVLFPVYALPLLLRGLSYIFPTTYYIPILRGMFLKGIGLAELWRQALALGILLVMTLTIASRLFRQRLD
jgi:ABC-2 type transport system permease protein